MKHALRNITVLLIIITATVFAQSKAPNFSLKTFDGKTIELAKLKGKAVVINFWATWCPPCRMEIPGFIDVYDSYKKKGLEIIGIALDDDGWEAVKPFADKIKINYPVVLGSPEIARLYGGIDGIPATFFIDKKGNIVGHEVGGLPKDVFEKKIKDLLQ